MGTNDDMNVRWANRDTFAEVAEVLRVPTDLVMAAAPRADGSVFVMWTPNRGDLTGVVTALLSPDADGVLVMVGQPRRVPFDVREAIRAALEERLGPPDEGES